MIAVTVHAGDTLSQIAQEHNVSLSSLERANPRITNPDLIYVGEQVVVPTGGSFTQWEPTHSVTAQSPSSSHSATYSPVHASSQVSSSASTGTSTSSQASSKWTPKSSPRTSSPKTTQYSAPVSQVPVPQTHSQQNTRGSEGSLDDIPGVPSSFVKCVAFRESTNGTNAAYNGGTYGIINASGYHVNGQSLSAQKQAFASIYKSTGPSAWAADGCPGT